AALQAVSDRCPSVSRELAIGEAEPGNRSAEGVFAGAFKIEARLEQHPPQCRANGLAADLQRIGRQVCVAHGARALELNGASDRAVWIDTALSTRAFEAGVAEHLADDEPARLVGAHLAGQRRQRGQEAGSQCNATQHSLTPTDATNTTAHSGRILGLTDYARLSSTNPERVYAILTT